MTRQEFLEECRAYPAALYTEPTAQEYGQIEYVYLHHPAISTLGAIKDIARLYTLYGMSVIIDMIPRAEVAKRLSDDIVRAQNRVKALEQEYNKLRTGKG